MIALSNKPLPPRAAATLNRFQAEVFASPDYATQVAEAKRLWAAKTHSARATFRTVRETLVEIHQGDPLCCYCGFSAADAIDHFCPHSLYPELTFSWENYVHACSRCNTIKGANFALFASDASVLPTELTRRAGVPVARPLTGEPALIDPRRENPMDFLSMNFFAEPSSMDHSRYLPLPGIDARSKSRAEYTIKLLGLNSRNDLSQGRKSAFGSYRDKMAEYVRLKQEGRPPSQLEHRIEAIKTERHRAVWEEMKRWHRSGWGSRDEELRIIFRNFDAAPEALDW